MKVDIISPVYNEIEGINRFLDTVEKVILGVRGRYSFNVILIDDGSTDGTFELLESRKYLFPTHIIRLSKNYGHQSALWTGIANSRAESYVITLDSDLQDDPTWIPSICSKFQDSYEIVLMVRASRKDGLFKKLFAQGYYFVQSRILKSQLQKNMGDFFGLSPIAKKALLSHEENIKYIRGLVSQLGFRKTIIEYHRNGRAAGKTHYTISKMFSLALSGVTGFSLQPLILGVYFSLSGVFFGVGAILYILYLKLFTDSYFAPGWAFSTIVTLMMFVTTLVTLSVLSLYTARIIQEIKKRPVSIIAQHIRIRKKGVERMEYKKDFYNSVTDRATITAKMIATELGRFIEVKSIVDVGSGDGTWIVNFSECFEAEKCVAIDLPSNDFEIIKKSKRDILLQKIDFEVDPYPLKEAFDLTIFVEVIEHITFTQSIKVLDNVLKNSTLLIFSGAVSGQGGTNHINERPFAFWFKMIEESGYVRLDLLRPILREHEKEVPHYYRNNICLFYNPTRLAGSEITVEWEGLLKLNQVSPRDLRSLSIKSRQSVLRLLSAKYVSKIAQVHNKVISLRSK